MKYHAMNLVMRLVVVTSAVMIIRNIVLGGVAHWTTTLTRVLEQAAGK